MSPVNGIEIGRKLLRADPDVYLVYLAAHPEYEFESYKLEVDQYILKEEFWHLWECVSESGKNMLHGAKVSAAYFLSSQLSPAQFVCHGFDLSAAFSVQSGFDGDFCLQPGDVL